MFLVVSSVVYREGVVLPSPPIPTNNIERWYLMDIKRFKELLIEAQEDGCVVVQTQKLKDIKSVSLQGEPSLVSKWSTKLRDEGAGNVSLPSPHPTNRSIDTCIASPYKSKGSSVADMSF